MVLIINVQFFAMQATLKSLRLDKTSPAKKQELGIWKFVGTPDIDFSAIFSVRQVTKYGRFSRLNVKKVFL